MKKQKQYILPACTLLLIVLFGFLPAITSKIQDSLTDDKIQYAEMKTLQLSRELNDLEKIYLLSHGEKMEITDRNTSFTRENMMEALKSALLPYHDAGFLTDDISNFTLQSQPYLYYDNTKSNFSTVIWQILMEMPDPEQSIYLLLDDSSGKILSISYECGEPIFKTSILYKHVSHLLSVYQSTLSLDMLTGQEFTEKDSVTNESELNHNQETYKQSVIWRFGDNTYGEQEIVIIVTETGFKIGPY